MSWYAIAYIIVIIAGCVYSAYDDMRADLAGWYIAVDAAVHVVWIYFFFTYYYPGLALPGMLLAVLLALAVFWTLLEVHREMQAVSRDRPKSYEPELSPALNLWIDRGLEVLIVAFAVALAAPAILAAFAVVRRAL